MTVAELVSERVLDRRSQAFEQLVRHAEEHVERGDDERAAAVAELAAFHATWLHHGSFASDRLDRVLSNVSAAALRSPTPSQLPNGDGTPRVLHIASMVHGLAGLQHLVARWVAADSERRHSVLVSQPSHGSVPDPIVTAVAESGGELFDAPAGGTTIIERAQRILDVSAAHTVAVLHLETEDVAPVIAMSHPRAPRSALVDHADHCFWVGRSGADLIVSLRRSGAEVCRERRGIDRSRVTLLPTPVPAASPHDRDTVRRSFDLADDAVVLISVARPPKYEPRGGRAFAQIHLPLLERHPNAHLLVVGPDADHHPSWNEARSVVGERLQVLGPRSDVPALLSASDIYVDAHPLVSITSLLEAGAAGLPVLSLCTHGPEPSIWGPDAPGLDPVILCCSTPDEYERQLARLIDDPEARADLGRATKRSIIDCHNGDAWRRAVDVLESRLADIEPCSAMPHGPATCRANELDRRVATLLDALSGVEDAHYRLTGRLPERELQSLLWQGWPDQRRQLVAMNVRHTVRRALGAVGLESVPGRVRSSVQARLASRRSAG